MLFIVQNTKLLQFTKEMEEMPADFPNNPLPAPPQFAHIMAGYSDPSAQVLGFLCPLLVTLPWEKKKKTSILYPTQLA